MSDLVPVGTKSKKDRKIRRKTLTPAQLLFINLQAKSFKDEVNWTVDELRELCRAHKVSSAHVRKTDPDVRDKLITIIRSAMIYYFKSCSSGGKGPLPPDPISEDPEGNSVMSSPSSAYGQRATAKVESVDSIE